MLGKILSIAVVSAMTIFPSISNALTVSESADFPNFGSFSPTEGLFLGELSLGSNTVSGSISGLCLAGGLPLCSEGDSRDSFNAILPTDLLLESISVTLSNLNGPSGFFANFFLRGESEGTIFRASRFFLGADTTIDISLAPPLEADTFSFNWNIGGADEIGPFSFDWIVKANTVRTTATVPEPGSLALFSLGLAGLSYMRRRKSLI